MLTRTKAFDNAVINGGSPVVRADIQQVNISSGAVSSTLKDIPLLPGAAVTLDTTAPTLRKLRASSVDPGDLSLTPTNPNAPLAPYLSELLLYSGFDYNDGSPPELLPCGVFRLEDVTPDTTGAIPLIGSDRSVVVAGAKFEVPYVIAAGTNLATAIHDIIDSRYPGLTYNLAGTGQLVPLTVYQENTDPWASAIALAAAGGMVLYFDATGTVVLRAYPDPTSLPPVWEYLAGDENLTTAATNRLVTLAPVGGKAAANVAVVTASGTGIAVPLRGEAEITNPLSPIYPGAFGRRPVFLNTSSITTQGDCDAAALALLLQNAGGSEQLSWSAAPHPALEGYDVVTVDLMADLGVIPTVAIQSFTFVADLTAPQTFVSVAARNT
jgi:hypothetical protein